MRITALDIYQQDFKKRFRGFDVNEVESFLEVLARDFEELVQENKALQSRITSLEGQLQEYQRKEQNIHDALLSIEKYSEDARVTVERETEVMIREARLQAETIIREAETKAAQVVEQITRLQHEKLRFIAQYRGAIQAQMSLLCELQQDDFSPDMIPHEPESEVDVLVLMDGEHQEEDYTEIEVLEGHEE